MVDRSACSNAPNIFSIFFSVSPMPVSTIEINTWINVYADGDANMLRKLDAFPIRFTRICLNRTGSDWMKGGTSGAKSRWSSIPFNFDFTASVAFDDLPLVGC